MNYKRAEHISVHHLCKEKEFEQIQPTPNGTHNSTLEYWVLVVEAIRKQLPQEPIVASHKLSADGNSITYTYACPSCHTELCTHFTYCPTCGQKISKK